MADRQSHSGLTAFHNALCEARCGNFSALVPELRSKLPEDFSRKYNTFFCGCLKLQSTITILQYNIRSVEIIDRLISTNIITPKEFVPVLPKLMIHGFDTDWPTIVHLCERIISDNEGRRELINYNCINEYENKDIVFIALNRTSFDYIRKEIEDDVSIVTGNPFKFELVNNNFGYSLLHVPDYIIDKYANKIKTLTRTNMICSLIGRHDYTIGSVHITKLFKMFLDIGLRFEDNLIFSPNLVMTIVGLTLYGVLQCLKDHNFSIDFRKYFGGLQLCIIMENIKKFSIPINIAKDLKDFLTSLLLNIYIIFNNSCKYAEKYNNIQKYLIEYQNIYGTLKFFIDEYNIVKRSLNTIVKLITRDEHNNVIINNVEFASKVLELENNFITTQSSNELFTEFVALCKSDNSLTRLLTPYLAV
uniref:Uncharacterized protein n=1 Tax=viral metagenome TaxID=1070528 RepID=A0A6C0ECY5_9ZZZZ